MAPTQRRNSRENRDISTLEALQRLAHACGHTRPPDGANAADIGALMRAHAGLLGHAHPLAVRSPASLELASMLGLRHLSPGELRCISHQH